MALVLARDQDPFRSSLNRELHPFRQPVYLKQHALDAHLTEDDRLIKHRFLEQDGDHGHEKGDGGFSAFLGLVQVDRLYGKVVVLQVSLDPEILQVAFRYASAVLIASFIEKGFTIYESVKRKRSRRRPKPGLN